MTAPEPTWTDALASALPAGVMVPLVNDWHAREIAAFQAERLAESGYVLLHPEYVDEATIERLARAISSYAHVLDEPEQIRFCTEDVLAALAAAPGPTDDEAVTPA